MAEKIQKRKSYSLHYKLHVANQVQKGVKCFGIQSIAKNFGLSQSVVKNWHAKKRDLERQLQD